MPARPEKRGGKPVPVGQALSRWLKTSGLGKRLELAGAVDRWVAAVGPQIAAVTRAELVNPHGTLWVRVLSSAWANELSLMTPRILAQLNQGVSTAGRVREIRWMVGRISD
ncbi:MAG: DciA family protein [Gemmatimonadales bacterium]